MKHKTGSRARIGKVGAAFLFVITLPAIIQLVQLIPTEKSERGIAGYRYRLSALPIEYTESLGEECSSHALPAPNRAEFAVTAVGSLKGNMLTFRYNSKWPPATAVWRGQGEYQLVRNGTGGTTADGNFRAATPMSRIRGRAHAESCTREAYPTWCQGVYVIQSPERLRGRCGAFILERMTPVRREDGY